jgi:hypothetical protein
MIVDISETSEPPLTTLVSTTTVNSSTNLDLPQHLLSPTHQNNDSSLPISSYTSSPLSQTQSSLPHTQGYVNFHSDSTHVLPDLLQPPSPAHSHASFFDVNTDPDALSRMESPMIDGDEDHMPRFTSVDDLPHPSLPHLQMTQPYWHIGAHRDG